MPGKHRKRSPNQRRHRIVCGRCKSVFYAGVPFAKYCSRICAKRQLYADGKVYSKHPRVLPGKKVVCSHCGKEIYRSPGQIRNSQSGKFYCNKQCKARSQPKKERISKPCANCGEIIHLLLSQVENHNFCNRDCCNQWQEQFVGSLSRHWKGGYHKNERCRVRSRVRWKRMRNRVLELYSNACAVCSKEISGLHLHHIVPVRWGGRDEAGNLIPLCPICHSKQTVKEWEQEHGEWRISGPHTLKGGDVYAG